MNEPKEPRIPPPPVPVDEVSPDAIEKRWDSIDEPPIPMRDPEPPPEPDAGESSES